VAAGASPSTPSPVGRSRRLPRTGRTRRDSFEPIDPMRPWSMTVRTSLGGVSSDRRPSSPREWEASPGWVRLRPTGGSPASSSTGTGGKKESGKQRWPARFAASPPEAAGRLTVIQSPPERSLTRAPSCGVGLSRRSPMPDSMRSVPWGRARWSCERWSASVLPARRPPHTNKRTRATHGAAAGRSMPP